MFVGRTAHRGHAHTCTGARYASSFAYEHEYGKRLVTGRTAHDGVGLLAADGADLEVAPGDAREHARLLPLLAAHHVTQQLVAVEAARTRNDSSGVG